MKNAVFVFLFFILCVSSWHRLYAVQTQTIVHQSLDSFAKGEFDNVIINEKGELSLSYTNKKLFSLPEPNLWKIITNSFGDSYFATGNDGRIYYLKNGDEKPSLFADLLEVQVTAIAFYEDGILAATSPDGKIYSISKTKKEPTIWIDLNEKYIWDIVNVKNGFAISTGLPGLVYFVSNDKKIDQLLDSNEAHVLSLAVDGSTIYAGTSQNGYVYKISLSKNDKNTVILDASGDEIKKLLVLPNHELVVLALDTQPGEGSNKENKLSGLFSQVINPSKDKQPSVETRIYLIENNKYPVELWSSSGLTGHSLGYFKDQILIGVAEDGKVISISKDRQSSLFMDTTSEQVTVISQFTNGKHLVGASNTSSVYLLEEKLSEEGVYTSPVIDSKTFATWGQIKVKKELPMIGSYIVQTRTGNTDIANNTWSDWLESKDDIKSPPARYLQYRLILKSNLEKTPLIRSVSIFYTPLNVQPLMQDIIVLDPGIRIEKKEEFKSEPEPKGINRPKVIKSSFGVKDIDDERIQSAKWDALDSNNDNLVYSVWIRAVSDKNWTMLSDKQEFPFINFQKASFKDGFYQLKITASDVYSNSPETALVSEKLSMFFPIDHNSPSIENLKYKVDGEVISVSFLGKDEVSLIKKVVYSVDHQPFLPIFPIDNVYDEHEESFSWNLNLPKGEHAISVKISDSSDNTSTSSILVKKP